MDIYEKLKEAGLTGNEAKVYLELLKKGELTANQIAKNIGMDRTLTYTVLNHLIDKGQVNYVVKEKKKIFSCSNPENLLNPIKAKEVLVFDLIKELKNIKKEKPEETEINVYEGREAIRLLARENLKMRHFDSFGATGRLYDFLFEAPALGEELERKGTTGRIIMGSKYKQHEFVGKYKSLKIRFLDIETEATTTIVGDKVMIHMIKGKPIVIIIKNKDIANSYRNYFEWMWNKAR